jgi:hypothetical protein
MPYIDPKARKAYDFNMEECSPLEIVAEQLACCSDADLPGDLNYIITYLINQVMSRKGEKYHRYNAIIGALECCKQELYRRHIGPYEDKAIERNGDVT